MKNNIYFFRFVKAIDQDIIDAQEQSYYCFVEKRNKTPGIQGLLTKVLRMQMNNSKIVHIKGCYEFIVRAQTMGHGDGFSQYVQQEYDDAKPIWDDQRLNVENMRRIKNGFIEKYIRT